MIEFLIAFIVASLIAWAWYRYGYKQGYNRGYEVAEIIIKGDIEIAGGRAFISDERLGRVKQIVIATDDKIILFTPSGEI